MVKVRGITLLTVCQQDANLLRIDQHMTGAQRDLALLKETVKRLDLGLYRLHGSAKSNQHAVRKVQGQIKDVHAVKAKVHMLRKEVDNLLFQLPSGKKTSTFGMLYFVCFLFNISRTLLYQAIVTNS